MGGTGKGGSKGEPAAKGRSPSPPPAEQRSGSPPPRGSSDPPAPEGVAPENVSMRAKICYNFLAFFAYWFGAARFDMDGDGDFDAADVQAMMNRGSSAIFLNFSRPVTSKKAKEARRKKVEAKRRQRAGHSIGDTVDGIFDADVEEEAQEDEIMDNLKQYWPWFTILEFLLCLGFWGVNAFNTRAYSLLQWDKVITDDLKLIQFRKDDPNDQLFLDDCKKECSGADETCVGIGWKNGPWPECFLLSSLPETDPTYLLSCQKDAWGWRTYMKKTWTPFDMFFTKGGLESIWPGFTTLTAYSYCHEGYDISFLWRWWSYQFTHGSITHVGANCFMLLMLGIPLEGWQGTGMFAVMWTIGVLGGALCWALFDPYTTSYGASGGCYSLLGMHAADLIQNWGDKKWRFGTIFIMLLVAGVESAAFWSSRDEESSTAHTVHIGGIVAGLLIIFTTGRNDHWKVWEYVCSAMAWAVAAILVIGSISFWFFFNEHPGIASLWKPLTGQTMERPFCWIGYVCIGDSGNHCPLIDDINDYTTSYTNTLRQCVMCDTRECVEGWYSDTYEVTTAGVTTEHYKYCPTEASRSYCTFTTDDSFDLWYPPTKSAYQLTDTPAPSPAPTPSPTPT
ncbi:unnamed protein product [Prorocentrum cordatum]|uniref:Peptidase S54 rhomboid domain-containing protein n=1 Tax=Prorocentrum cordatum TaxID=2364126 RepID=A0ABN9U5X6_9DINO|nr:unnamed protein product [Polarella glacialis]